MRWVWVGVGGGLLRGESPLEALGWPLLLRCVGRLLGLVRFVGVLLVVWMLVL